MRIAFPTVAGTLVAALLFAAPASAEVVKYKAMVSPSTEVPPVEDSHAAGTLSATYDTSTMTLTYEVGYADLSGPATMAHFHGPAPAGKNAGVMVPIPGDLSSPLKGSVKLTEDQAKALVNGDLYFNIHTPTNKNGEMRGQVVKAM